MANTRKTKFLPDTGERAIIVGQTGSGKTAFSVWMLLRIPVAPIVIYDTKVEEKFDKLPNSIVVNRTSQILEQVHNPEIDYIIVRPPENLLGKPQELDEYLWFHYINLHRIPAYIDEAAEFHTPSGTAFKGLMALLARGRSKGITTIAATQRPRRISLSLLTESQKAYIFHLKLSDDRKRIADLIPDYDDLPQPPKFSFYFYVDGDERPRLFAPVKLDSRYDTGYASSPVEAENAQEREEPATKGHIWI